MSTAVTMFSVLPLEPVLLDLIVPLNESRPKSLILKTDYSVYGINVNEYYFAIITHQILAIALQMTFLTAVNTFIIIVVEHCCGLFKAVG